MCKKFIIETHENSSAFGILYIYFVNGEERGFLRYFSVFDDGQLHEITEFEQGWEELSEKLIDKAEKVCDENGAVLWSY